MNLHGTLRTIRTIGTCVLKVVIKIFEIALRSPLFKNVKSGRSTIRHPIILVTFIYHLCHYHHYQTITSLSLCRPVILVIFVSWSLCRHCCPQSNRNSTNWVEDVLLSFHAPNFFWWFACLLRCELIILVLCNWQFVTRKKEHPLFWRDLVFN